MARAGTVCRKSGCPKRAHRLGLCAGHASEAELQRGTTTERGYGSAHQQRASALRKRYLNTLCPVCGKPMKQYQKLEAAHTTPLVVDPASVADALVHAGCNPRGTDPRNYAPQG